MTTMAERRTEHETLVLKKIIGILDKHFPRGDERLRMLNMAQLHYVYLAVEHARAIDNPEFLAALKMALQAEQLTVLAAFDDFEKAMKVANVAHDGLKQKFGNFYNKDTEDTTRRGNDDDGA